MEENNNKTCNCENNNKTEEILRKLDTIGEAQAVIINSFGMCLTVMMEQYEEKGDKDTVETLQGTVETLLLERDVLTKEFLLDVDKLSEQNKDEIISKILKTILGL